MTTHCSRFQARSPFLLGGLLLLAACASTDRRLDLARNRRLYRDASYSVRVPGDRTLFVAPLVDRRDASSRPTRDGGGFPILYGADGVWDRPVPEMIDEVFAREVRHSRLFASLHEQAAPDDLVLMPVLEEFATGAVERVGGAQSFAEVALRVRVLGPVDAPGHRPVLLDRVYADRKITSVSMDPPSPYLLIGSVLQTAVRKALAGLDGSNVGRSAVPVPADITR